MKQIAWISELPSSLLILIKGKAYEIFNARLCHLENGSWLIEAWAQDVLRMLTIDASRVYSDKSDMAFDILPAEKEWILEIIMLQNIPKRAMLNDHPPSTQSGG